MTLWQAVILGLVQGLTEFLPVSSSAHLVLAEHALGLPTDIISFDVAVHVGTLAAVCVYFHRRLLALAQTAAGRPQSDMTVTAGRRLLLFLIVGSIPAGVVGLLFRHQIEQVFGESHLSALFLMVTGLLLVMMHFVRARSGDLTLARSWWIGCAQAVAILPGISRSGSTIAAGCMLGVRPALAAEFSFLLSVPAVGGAALLSLGGAWQSGQLGLPHLVGALVAAVSGFVAIRIVFAVLARGRFVWFGVYCLIVGAVAGILLL